MCGRAAEERRERRRASALLVGEDSRVVHPCKAIRSRRRQAGGGLLTRVDRAAHPGVDAGAARLQVDLIAPA
eukprot:750866-Hanusia_phi.AAC.4